MNLQDDEVRGHVSDDDECPMHGVEVSVLPRQESPRREAPLVGTAIARGIVGPSPMEKSSPPRGGGATSSSEVRVKAAQIHRALLSDDA